MQPRRVGLVLTRPSRVLGEEPYYHEFIEGLERMLTPMGVSVLLPEFRGYGRSAGVPTQETLRADMTAFYDELVRRLKNKADFDAPKRQ